MPTYSYVCDECGPYDLIHSMDENIVCCQRCNSTKFRKSFSKVGVQFKGKGFYSTDSRKSSGK